MLNLKLKLGASVGPILLASLALAAGSAATGTARAADSVTLRMAAGANGPFTQSFNPFANTNTNGKSKQMIYEPLMMNTLYKNGMNPWIATSYRWSNGGKAVTINLRHDVRFSDGVPMTSADVAFSFQLLAKYPAANQYSLPIASVSAPSKYTTVVRFTEPSYRVRWWSTLVLPKHVWQGVDDPITYTDPTPVGTGPFMFKSFSTQAITLGRNPHFWGPKPKIDTVQYLAFDSETSMLASLQAGQVDWVVPGSADAPAIAKQVPGKIGYWVYEKPNIIFLYANNGTAPTNDKALRLAMSSAIDRRTIAVESFFDKNPPEFNPTGLNSKVRGQFIAKPFKKLTLSYDPSAAKSILTKAGYKLGANGVFSTPEGKPLSLSITVPTSSNLGDLVRAAKGIADNLTAAGIATTVKTESSSAWKKDYAVGNFQLTLIDDGGSPAIYDLYADIFAQDSKALLGLGQEATLNLERYAKPSADGLLASFAASLPGSKQQAAALEGLQRLMVTEAPIIPLWRVSASGMWRSDRFTGFPSAKNPYAAPSGNDATSELTLIRIAPVK
jgi:peptide/nickel transport system substrate-binding protein